MFGLDFSRSKISSRRALLSYSKIQQLVAAVIRGRRPLMNLKTEGLVLDVGCGPNINSANLNMDYSWRPGIDICCDITKGLPLRDAYVAGIFTEHCIEHIPFDAAIFVFGEFLRVMRPGVHIRIVVPSLEIYLDAYDLFRKTGQLSIPYASEDARKGIYSPAMSINRIFREHGHQFIYDFSTLESMLRKVGFTEIKNVGFRQGATPSLLLDTAERAVESLYVEAKKP